MDASLRLCETSVGDGRYCTDAQNLRDGRYPAMLALLAPAAASLVYECNSDRGGPHGYSHRTLKMPQSFVDRASASDISSYGAALCCVYTHIESTASSSQPVEMINMDGRSLRIPGTTFAEVAQNAYDEGCDMYYGSQDCKKCESPSHEPEGEPEQSSCRDTKKNGKVKKNCKVKKCRKKKSGKLKKKYARVCAKTCGQCH